MKKCVIYARYSSERQTEQSIEGQLRVCYEFAKNNELIVVHEYIDRAMTGTNDLRKEFQQMLSDSERTKEWDICLVYAQTDSEETLLSKQSTSTNCKRQVKLSFLQHNGRREI